MPAGLCQGEPGSCPEPLTGAGGSQRAASPPQAPLKAGSRLGVKARRLRGHAAQGSSLVLCFAVLNSNTFLTKGQQFCFSLDPAHLVTKATPAANQGVCTGCGGPVPLWGDPLRSVQEWIRASEPGWASGTEGGEWVRRPGLVCRCFGRGRLSLWTVMGPAAWQAPCSRLCLESKPDHNGQERPSQRQRPPGSPFSSVQLRGPGQCGSRHFGSPGRGTLRGRSLDLLCPHPTW